MKCNITFLEESTGRSTNVEASPGERLTQAAYRAGVLIQQTCGGSPSCTDCKVVVKEGNFNAPEGAELRLLGNVYFITKERLACQAIIVEDSTVLVPRYENKQDLKNKKFLSRRLENRNDQKKKHHEKQKEKQKNCQENQQKSQQKEKDSLKKSNQEEQQCKKESPKKKYAKKGFQENKKKQQQKEHKKGRRQEKNSEKTRR